LRQYFVASLSWFAETKLDLEAYPYIYGESLQKHKSDNKKEILRCSVTVTDLDLWTNDLLGVITVISTCY